jgi:hypothetical protein
MNPNNDTTVLENIIFSHQKAIKSYQMQATFTAKSLCFCPESLKPHCMGAVMTTPTCNSLLRHELFSGKNWTLPVLTRKPER